jgi:hypothetical protein
VKIMLSVIQQRTIPGAIRALSGMERPDYIDVFTVTTNGAAEATPEQWFRTALEEVAGRGGQFIWRGVLGLRLKSQPSIERVAGWKIADRGKDWIRLEASSWFMTAHLVARLMTQCCSPVRSSGTTIRLRHSSGCPRRASTAGRCPACSSRRYACEPVIHMALR